jgi:cell division protein FtsB
MTANTRKPVIFFGSFVLLSAIVSFFGFHIISGERGLLARPSLELKIVQAEEQVMLLEKHQRFLQQRIALLHSGSVDADILAETARSELGLYGPNDVIVSIDLSDFKF